MNLAEWGTPGGGTPITKKMLHARCKEYIANRRATYEMRMKRFALVAHLLEVVCRLSNEHTLFDLGAGHCQFDYFLRTERDWRGVYVPVDGAIDGTDLQTWRPRVQPDAYVLMEVLEHLNAPLVLLDRLKPRRGVIITVPNPAKVDVLGCDSDHRSIITRKDLESRGFRVRAHSFFGKQYDTLVAWRSS